MLATDIIQKDQKEALAQKRAKRKNQTFLGKTSRSSREKEAVRILQK